MTIIVSLHLLEQNCCSGEHNCQTRCFVVGNEEYILSVSKKQAYLYIAYLYRTYLYIIYMYCQSYVRPLILPFTSFYSKV